MGLFTVNPGSSTWMLHLKIRRGRGGELMWKGGKDVINSTRSGEVFVDMGGMFDLYSILILRQFLRAKKRFLIGGVR